MDKTPNVRERQKAVMPSETRIKEFKGLLQSRGGVEIHRHFEGVLNAHDLEEIAKKNEVSMTGNSETDSQFWKGVSLLTKPSENKDLSDFIKALPTKYMRLIMTKAILDKDKDGHAVLGTMVDTVLAKAHEEGITDLELLACPYALSTNGNLKATDVKPPTLEENMSEEEKLALSTEYEILKKWHNQYESEIQQDQMRGEKKHIPNNESYLTTIRDRVRKNEDYDWTKDKGEKKKMSVGVRFCIRREAPFEAIYQNGESGSEGKDLINYAKQRLIVGVDIAGFEIAVPLTNYTDLFQKLSLPDNNVPYTVHAGEIPRADTSNLDRKNVKIAFDNLYLAIMGDPDRKINPARGIGHATMLAEYTEDVILGNGKTMPDLLEQAIIKKIPIHVNITSNEWTRVVQNKEVNPWVLALQGKHPLFDKKPYLLDGLKEILVITTDDPVVWEDGIHDDCPLAVELGKVWNHVTEAGSDPKTTPAAIHKMTLENGRKALL